MCALKDIEAKDRIIVALDCSAKEALQLADSLSGKATWLKIGMTLFYKEGPAFVQALKEKGFKIFVDLKIYDIPFQAAGAARSVVLSGADMFTLHASGGSEMMQGIAQITREFEPEPPVSLGVTVLTSMDDSTLQELNISKQAAEQVCDLARLVQKSGISGVVASPQEAAQLRELLGPDAYIVTPGVRPAGAALDDQKRVATPYNAIAQGASHIVVGRPITKAEDPIEVFDAIVAEIASIKPEDWRW